jgi:hypothetical protein
MERLDDALADDTLNPRLFGATAGFVCGAFLVGIGTLSVVYDAILGLAGAEVALRLAPTLVGTAFATGLAIAAVVVDDRTSARRLGIGLGLTYVGVALTWVVVPTGWTGQFTAAMVVPAIVAALGLLALSVTFVSAVVAAERANDVRPVVSSRSTAGGFGTDLAIPDGGKEEVLDMLLDDEDEPENERDRL